MEETSLTPYILVLAFALIIAMIIFGKFAESELGKISQRTNFIFALSTTVLAFVTLWLSENDKKQKRIIDNLVNISKSQDSSLKTMKNLLVEQYKVVKNQNAQIGELISINKQTYGLLELGKNIEDRGFQSGRSELEYVWKKVQRVFSNGFSNIQDEGRKDVRKFVLDNIDEAERLLNSLTNNPFVEDNPAKKEFILTLRNLLQIGKDRLTRTGFSKCSEGLQMDANDLLSKFAIMFLTVSVDLTNTNEYYLRNQYLPELKNNEEKLNRCQ